MYNLFRSYYSELPDEMPWFEFLFHVEKDPMFLIAFYSTREASHIDFVHKKRHMDVG